MNKILWTIIFNIIIFSIFNWSCKAIYEWWGGNLLIEMVNICSFLLVFISYGHIHHVNLICVYSLLISWASMTHSATGISIYSQIKKIIRRSTRQISSIFSFHHNKEWNIATLIYSLYQNKHLLNDSQWCWNNST